MKPILFGAFALCIAAVAPSCVDAGYGYGTSSYGGHGGGYRSGYVVNTLPYGYREEYIGGSRYYSHNNTYYRRQGTTYVVVDSPRRVATRPSYRPSDRYDNRHDDHRDRDHDRDGRGRDDGRRDGDRDRDGRPGPPGSGGPGTWKPKWN